MNIEQIALETWREIHGFDAVFMRDEQVEFLRRCLAKLAKQDVEPVAWMYEYSYDLNGDKQGNWPVEMQAQVSFSATKPDGVATKLYTEDQLLAVQQRTAEACVKFLDDMNHSGCDLLAIRNGEWREYL